MGPRVQRRAFAILALLTVVVMVARDAIGRPLVTEAAPLGIVSFEFAGDVATATRILEGWGEAGRVRAGLIQGLDYLFLVLYASAIGLGCLLVAGAAGPVLAWGQVAAALLDSVENFALIRLLLGSDNAVWPTLAWGCAALKFALVGAGLVTVLVGFPIALVRRRG
jgi:hypothetical protein